jgi:hypothetical protein
MRMYDGEAHFLQLDSHHLHLDSHHRFADDWDRLLLKQMEQAGGDLPVLTTYAPAFTPEQLPGRSSRPTRIEIDAFTDEGIPLLRPAFLSDRPTGPGVVPNASGFKAKRLSADPVAGCVM